MNFNYYFDLSEYFELSEFELPRDSWTIRKYTFNSFTNSYFQTATQNSPFFL